jgi:hypothetical protein
MRLGLSLLVVLALCSLPLQAAVYTYVDAEGNRVFTDQPDIEGASRVQVRPPNVSTPEVPVKKLVPQPAAVPAEAVPPVPEPVELAYQMLRIALPEPDAAVQSNGGGLLVVLESDPPLLPGHFYRLEMDGQIQGVPNRSPVFTLEGVERGTHQLAGEIIDSKGEVLERTPAQPVHVQRMTLDQRRRVNNCKEEDYGKRKECPLSLQPRKPL